jgi:hypothetical protein
MVNGVHHWERDLKALVFAKVWGRTWKLYSILVNRGIKSRGENFTAVELKQIKPENLRFTAGKSKVLSD